MRERLPVGGGPLSVRPVVATGACDATGGFSEATPSDVNASEVAAVVVALSTCQHVPAIGEMEREQAENRVRHEMKNIAKTQDLEEKNVSL